MITSPSESRVLEQECLDPKTAAAHLRQRLATTTDPSDLHADLARAIPGLAVEVSGVLGVWR